MRKIVCLICFLPLVVNAQLKTDWQHLDPELDSVLGVSSYRAYEYLKDKKSETVIVAVIDNGAELTHKDLQGQFWRNPNEMPDNGIDDDKNGYIDDIHGWNFLGNQKGVNIKRETKELTRIYAKLREKYGSRGLSVHNQEDSLEYIYYKKIKLEFEKELKKKNDEINLYNLLLANYQKANEILMEHFGKKDYSKEDLKSLKSSESLLNTATAYMFEMLANNLTDKKIKGIIANLEQDLETRLNPFFKIRDEIIGDNPADLSDSIYGNKLVDAMSPYHGTGVAGTIGALWDSVGVNGIAGNVKLMILRVLPNGDERDKDVALAIRYAVRNGADIINCSFGKQYSSYPEFVQQAIKEAEKADILIVHAAGNDSKNNDSIPTFPTGYYQDGSKALNWLSVGASGSKDDENLVAFFSNYGKQSVDIFAPGVDIKSCVLGSKYDWASGTSTATPVVTGIAAVLKSYYPQTTAKQLKEIIIQSSYQPKTKKVYLPGSKELAYFKDLSVSGGIVNLYRAILLVDKQCLIKK